MTGENLSKPNTMIEDTTLPHTTGQPQGVGIRVLFAAIGPTCSAVQVLRTLRDEFKETVTRQEVNMKLLGASMAAMRKDAGMTIPEMAARLRVDFDDISMFESGLGGLNLGHQVEYLKALGCSANDKDQMAASPQPTTRDK